MAAVFGNKSFTINDWRVDPALNRVTRADEVIKIDPQNMKVLELLASRPGEVISQAEIEQTAWEGVIVTPNSVYQSIAQLRRALGDDRTNPKYIETIARRGYRCVGQVSQSTVTREVGADSTKVERKRRVAPFVRFGLVAIFSVLIVLVVAIRYEHTTRSEALLGFEDALATAAHEAPIVRASRLLSLGESALLSGYPNQALSYYEDALKYVMQDGQDTGARAQVLAQISRALVYKGDSEGAIRFAREALGLLGDIEEDNPRAQDSHLVLGQALLDTREFEQAEVHIRAAIEGATRLYGEKSAETLIARELLGRMSFAQGKWADAQAITTDVLRELTRLRGEEDLDGATTRTMLARALYYQGKYSESLRETERAIKILGEIARPSDPNMGAAQQALADNLVKLGDHVRAEQVARACAEIWRENDSEPWRIARAKSTLGEALLKQGKLEEAEKHLAYADSILAAQSGFLEERARLENDRRIELLRLARKQANAHAKGSAPFG